ncbi:MAG: 16S rRNA (adenine(1518)-N(6)/adenine(1519)-N(6))-dimethyltransferase RsmA [Actinomycetota bacterium]|nr:16S rRNA (adenine(1518)-N(6)/adenine(1519)-N(6))-dimethyltransferase RsmA [Actinomycetota bacterium]
MSGLASPRKTIDILKKYNLRLSKSLGQNFLVDENILKKIIHAANLKSEDVVLEVGSGIGTLTQVLAERAGQVIAVELDRTLIPILSETLKGFENVKLLRRDALKLDLNLLPPSLQPNKLVSNLPYNIASPLLVKYLHEYPQIELFVVTIQKELAERILASPGGKDYGAFTLKIQYYSEPKMISIVPRTVFLPPPKVDSAVIKLKRLSSPRVGVKHPSHLFELITAAFEHRRKTIKNSLIHSSRLSYGKREVEKALKGANIDPERRGETLSIYEFALLSESLQA